METFQALQRDGAGSRHQLRGLDGDGIGRESARLSNRFLSFCKEEFKSRSHGGILKSNLDLATPLPVALRRDDALSFEASVMAKFEIPAAICNFLLICWIQTNLFPLALARGSTIPSTESIPQRDNLRDSGLVLVKIGCLIILFVGTFLAGISPYFCKWNYAFLVLGTQFAGGVFLATALIHFLSDANSTFQEHTNVDYPFAFMLATAGYLVTMYGDCLIQWIMTHESAAGRVKFDKVDDKSDLEAVGAETELSAINIANSSPKEKQCCEREDLTNSELKISQLFTSAASDDKCSCSGESLKCCTCTEEFNETDGVRNIVKATLIQTASFGDSILLIVALCFHSLFEGIAIGVAETKIDAWKALWTIFLHKIFAAIAMGIALLRMIPDRPFISSSAYSFFFAISSPIGISIGILLDATAEGSVADWFYAISMGFASGIFVYVAINHLLVKGYVPPCKVAVDTPFYKSVAVLTGATVIAVVMIWDT